MDKITLILILSTLVVWSVYDIYLIIKKEKTISQKITWMSRYKTPAIPLLLGFLMGHWFS